MGARDVAFRSVVTVLAGFSAFGFAYLGYGMYQFSQHTKGLQAPEATEKGGSQQ